MRRKLQEIVSSLLLLIAQPVEATPSSWFASEIANMHVWKGRFYQPDYGFSVDAPPGISKYITKGGDANHGVRIVLGYHRDIDIFPEFINLDIGNEPCALSQFGFSSGSVKVVTNLRLGGKPACSVTYLRGQDEQFIIQSKKDNPDGGILYTLMLSTNLKHAQSDRSVFRSVAAMFRQEPN